MIVLHALLLSMVLFAEVTTATAEATTQANPAEADSSDADPAAPKEVASTVEPKGDANPKKPGDASGKTTPDEDNGISKVTRRNPQPSWKIFLKIDETDPALRFKVYGNGGHLKSWCFGYTGTGAVQTSALGIFLIPMMALMWLQL